MICFHHLVFLFVFRPTFGVGGYYLGPPMTRSLLTRRPTATTSIVVLGSWNPLDVVVVVVMRAQHDDDGVVEHDPPLVGDGSSSEEEEETIRVRIWRILADGKERTLQELGKAIGHHRDLRSHLKHVARQAETLQTKSRDWRIRRGLPAEAKGDLPRMDKIRLTMRKGKRRKETFVRLG